MNIDSIIDGKVKYRCPACGFSFHFGAGRYEGRAFDGEIYCRSCADDTEEKYKRRTKKTP